MSRLIKRTRGYLRLFGIFVPALWKITGELPLGEWKHIKLVVSDE